MGYGSASVKDRRKEPRVESTGIGDLTSLKPAHAHLTVTVVDVSRSGMQIKSAGAFEKGGVIRLQMRELIVVGDVRHCRESEGHYRAGILIREVIDSPLETRHLPDEDLVLYLQEKGLSEAQRYFYAAHLELCAPCRLSMAEASDSLERNWWESRL